MINISRLLHTYSNVSPYRTEMINSGFNGIPGPEKKLCVCIARYGDFVANMYITITKKTTQRIRNFYRLYRDIWIEIGGYKYINIPTEYISLYYKVIKGIDINILSDGTKTIIPIELNDLINIPFILLCRMHECRLWLNPNPIKIFDHDYIRQVSLNPSWPDYETYINVLPKDVWRIILNLLDDKNWGNLRQTCKFFYSIQQERDIINRYEKYKVEIKDIIDLDCSVNFMIGSLSKPIANGEGNNHYKFINEYREIKHIDIDLKNQKSHNIRLEPEISLEWIIININHYQRDILDHIELIESITPMELKIINEINEIDQNCVYIISDNSEFYTKMHNPNENRYMFLTDKSLTDLNLVFKEIISATVDVYVSYRNWITFTDKWIYPSK